MSIPDALMAPLPPLIPTWGMVLALAIPITALHCLIVGLCYVIGDNPRAMTRAHHTARLVLMVVIIALCTVIGTILCAYTTTFSARHWLDSITPMWVRIFAWAAMLAPAVSYAIMLVDHTDIVDAVDEPARDVAVPGPYMAAANALYT